MADDGGHLIQHQANIAYSMQAIPSKKKQGLNSNSATVNRKEKGMVGLSKLPEQLQEEVLKLKQTSNTHKEENVKLKTKVKILENEMGRKERALEDFMQQNQFIANA